MTIKYHGLQIVKGNAQYVQKTNFGIWEKIILSSSQWEVSVQLSSSAACLLVFSTSFRYKRKAENVLVYFLFLFFFKSIFLKLLWERGCRGKVT